MAAVSVTTAATRLDTANETGGHRGSSIAAYNNGSAIVYLGGSGVTTATGLPLAPGAYFSTDLGGTSDLPAETLAGSDDHEGVYGIVASGTVEVRTFEVGLAV